MAETLKVVHVSEQFNGARYLVECATIPEDELTRVHLQSYYALRLKYGDVITIERTDNSHFDRVLEIKAR